MLKKMLALVLVQMMMVTSAFASSLFPDMDSLQPKEELAPSYGVMIGKQPDDRIYEADGVVHIYNNVPEDQYHAFGSLLTELGYQAIGQETRDDAVIVEVGNGEISFKVGYLAKKKQLQVLYPTGVKYEKVDPLAAYTVVKAEQPFTLAGSVQVTIHQTGYLQMTTAERPVVQVTIKNVSQKTVIVGFSFASQLHLLTENENHYQFDVYDIGKITQLSSGSCAISGVVLDPLESQTVVCAFATSTDNVRGVSDLEKGAITFELGGDKYVWYYYEK